MDLHQITYLVGVLLANMSLAASISSTTLTSSLIMGWEGSVGLINGLIAAAIGALSMLMSEPTAKGYVKRTCMFALSIATVTVFLQYIL